VLICRPRVRLSRTKASRVRCLKIDCRRRSSDDQDELHVGAFYSASYIQFFLFSFDSVFSSNSAPERSKRTLGGAV